MSKKFIEQRKQSLAKITSPMGILIRTNRSIQSEIAIVEMAYDINKLHHKIQDNRTGTQLHGELSA